MKLKPFWAGLLPALALCGALLCTTIVSAQEAAPETKKEEPAAAAAETPKAEEPKAEAAKPEESKPEAAEATEAKKEETAAAPVDGRATLDEVAYAVDNVILFLCAVLVIFMQAGFALVETGLNSSKNAVNIMFKNFMDFVVGAILFFLIGYGIMYPGDEKGHIIPNVFGFAQVGVPANDDAVLPTAEAAHPLGNQVNFLFQVAFAATAATIVSGSVAGRIKFPAYLIYTAVISALIYPISGMWHWGGGWLADMGFVDFAGSLVVHAVGGFAGLAGAIALGPRLGRYVNGKPQAMPGHNIPYVALGVFILMIGWYGFNPGSQLAFTGVSNTNLVMKIAVNTTLGGCAGALLAMMIGWVMFGKSDFTFALNGSLAGLVAVTANCHIIENYEALIIGAVGGVVVIGAILLLDKLQIDDPVGAFPVHGCCGVWAGIATGIFGDGANLGTQILGVAVYAAWALSASLAMFYALKAVGLLRVDAEEELAGLDICEHGMYAYPQNVVALDSVNSSFGSSQMMHSTSMATKPATESV